MNNNDNSITQLILDHQMISAYRNGVMNAQLRSLYPSFGLHQPTDEIVSPPLTDSSILQALMSSVTPQDQLATQIALLNNALRTTSSPLLAPSSISNVAVDDILRALGNNSNSSVLSPPMLYDVNGLLGSMLQEGTDRFRPSSNLNFLNQINSAALAQNEERNAQNLSIEMLNAISSTRHGMPSVNSSNHITSDAYDLVRKRHAEEFLLSEQAKKARMTEIMHQAQIIPRYAVARDESLRALNRSTVHHKSKKSRSIKKDKKERGREAKTASATYEDAQLLFDSFATLASGGKAVAKVNSSIISIDESEGSILKYEDHCSNSELTSAGFWETVPHFVTISMAQMSLARMKPSGKFVDLCNTSELGHAAMCCKHCKGIIGFGAHFFKNLRQGNHIHRIVKHVQSDCTVCPITIRSSVQKLCTPITSRSLGLTLSDSFESKAFFEHVWSRLCVAGFVDGNVDADFHDNRSKTLDAENATVTSDDDTSEE